ncbi:MAG TPA: RraA family protein [Bryobacteraceae bacterium]|jgi:regulator of RNase E activity RraA
MAISCEEAAARLRKIPTATVYDVMDKMGYPNQALAAAIRPIAPGWRVAGPALTMQGSSTASFDGKRGSAMSYEMFRAIQPGQIIVFDTRGHNIGGPWGGNTGANAKVKGATGIVIDGGTRDYSDLVEMQFPTFCRFVTPVLSHGRFSIESFNRPISMTGQVAERVQVNPSDFVLADDDGVVIVPRSLLEDVLSHSEVADKAEREMRAAIESGEDRESINKRINRWPGIVP